MAFYELLKAARNAITLPVGAADYDQKSSENKNGQSNCKSHPLAIGVIKFTVTMKMLSHTAKRIFSSPQKTSLCPELASLLRLV